MQLLMAKDLAYFSEADATNLISAAEHVGRALNGLINSIGEKTA